MVSASRVPRTLTQMLRDWADPAVAQLLLARPELAFPTPTDFSQVASRATTRASVSDALATLNAFELWVARRACDPSLDVTAANVAATDADPADVEVALQRLLRLALLWGDADRLRPVRALTTLWGDEPAGPPPAQTPPTFPDAARQSAHLVDKVAAGSAFELVRRMDVLVEHCDHQPLRLRRSGGLATREVRALAELLDVPVAVASAHLEIARAAGLLGVSARAMDEVLLPTHAFDGWQELPLAEQWAALVTVWFAQHPDSGDAWLKRLCLEAFGDPALGVVLSVPDLRAWLAWQRPRRAATVDRQVSTMLEQATWLGVTGLGAVASFGAGVDVARLADLLPERVDHVLVQADLTAVAPGPLTVEAARDLGALADVESRGGATVYRFSVDSLRRGHDLGWSADEIATTLRERSRTPLPQPLSYLISDLERRPAVSAPSGSVYVPPGQHRNPERGVPSPPAADAGPADRLDEPAALAIVRGMRNTHAEHAEATRLAAGQDREGVFESPLVSLREAVETGETVWFGYVDTTGSSGERLVRAVAVEEGRLRAVDVRTDESLTVPVHRITSAHILRGQ